MPKTATAHRRAIQDQTESSNLNFPFLLLTPLTLSYLCLFYPQYLYLLIPVANSESCYENCGRGFPQKKREHPWGRMLSSQSGDGCRRLHTKSASPRGTGASRLSTPAV